MKTFYEILSESLRGENIGPARRVLDGGRRTLRWHVDNCDDRFVDMRFAEHDPDVVGLVIRRNRQ